MGRYALGIQRNQVRVEEITVEGVTNRGLCGRDGSASDQDTVTKVRHYYHVHRGSHCHALFLGGTPSPSTRMIHSSKYETIVGVNEGGA